MQTNIRVNVGCGATPTRGWMNFDNSPVVRLSTLRALLFGLRAARILSEAQMRFAEVAREQNIRWADGGKRLPLAASSAEVIYSSHMLEHLDRREALACLNEFFRVLAPGGTVRLAVPDIERSVRAYLKHGDADHFIASTYLAQPRPRGALARLRLALVGHREHMWMYDARSLGKLLESVGFVDVDALSPGETTISSPGNLDLCEREEESIYLEGRKPFTG